MKAWRHNESTRIHLSTAAKLSNKPGPLQTSDLQKRVYQHKMKSVSGFTKKYNVNKLIYYEVFNDIYNAFEHEKQIKSGSRQKKFDLVNSFNPEWEDLYDDL